MNGPCYSAAIEQALNHVVVIWWALWAIVALGAIAVFFSERTRPR